MEFRERLYQLRKGRGISQEELAHTCLLYTSDAADD